MTGDHVANTKETSRLIGMETKGPTLYVLLMLRLARSLFKSPATCWYVRVPKKSNLADEPCLSRLTEVSGQQLFMVSSPDTE